MQLQTQVQILQAQLAQRPPLETIQDLEKEYKNLDLLLQGTQRENERCMAEMERRVSPTPDYLHSLICVRYRGKTREKMLERELARFAGENWQVCYPQSRSPSILQCAYITRKQTTLDIAPSSATAIRPTVLHGRSNTLTTPPRPPTDEPSNQATLAHIEQIRLLILGMEQRLQGREEKLIKTVERAEAESARFEDIRKEVLA